MRHHFHRVLFISLAVLTAGPPVRAADPPGNKKADFGKGRIEVPLKETLAAQFLPAVKEILQGKNVPAEVKAKVDAPAKKKADRGKGRIEVPLKVTLAAQFPPAAKEIVQGENSPTEVKPTANATPSKAKTDASSAAKTVTPARSQLSETPAPLSAENPRVEPGKVRWHKDFAAACAASRKSGKPVLLFHLLGRLDQRFT